MRDVARIRVPFSMCEKGGSRLASASAPQPVLRPTRTCNSKIPRGSLGPRDRSMLALRLTRELTVLKSINLKFT